MGDYSDDCLMREFGDDGGPYGWDGKPPMATETPVVHDIVQQLKRCGDSISLQAVHEIEVLRAYVAGLEMVIVDLKKKEPNP